MRREVEIYAREEGLEFCETSAKHKENVEEVFKKLALKVLERKKSCPSCKSEVVSKSVQTETSSPSTFHLEEDSENKPKKKWKGCCKLL
ncbi:unnamed protein product [Larinioides sclopetarius]|uniref:Uncharacterized protein n=1 Tax=Larinioides sclopetarius TaxID=280406 RepID=A0AAV2AEI9_9ARAC